MISAWVASRVSSSSCRHLGQSLNQSRPSIRQSLSGMTVCFQLQAGQMKVRGRGGIGIVVQSPALDCWRLCRKCATDRVAIVSRGFQMSCFAVLCYGSAITQGEQHAVPGSEAVSSAGARKPRFKKGKVVVRLQCLGVATMPGTQASFYRNALTNRTTRTPKFTPSAVHIHIKRRLDKCCIVFACACCAVTADAISSSLAN